MNSAGQISYCALFSKTCVPLTKSDTLLIYESRKIYTTFQRLRMIWTNENLQVWQIVCVWKMWNRKSHFRLQDWFKVPTFVKQIESGMIDYTVGTLSYKYPSSEKKGEWFPRNSHSNLLLNASQGFWYQAKIRSKFFGIKFQFLTTTDGKAWSSLGRVAHLVPKTTTSKSETAL